MPSQVQLTLTINGRKREISTAGERTLLDVLREDFQLTGTKYGCGEGACAACTVLVDGKPRFSCSTLASEVAGKQIITIEGLGQGSTLHPVQQAFLDEGAFQCGYCTAGMIMAGVALLETTPSPTHDDIVRAMDGNVCRCGAYPQIVAAIQRAASVPGEKRP